MYFNMRFCLVAIYSSQCSSFLSYSLSSSAALHQGCYSLFFPSLGTVRVQVSLSSRNLPRPWVPFQVRQSMHPQRNTSNQLWLFFPWIYQGAIAARSQCSSAYPLIAWAPFFCLSLVGAALDIPPAALAIFVSPLGSLSPIPWLSGAVYSHR